MILFYDTETTGLIDFKARSSATHQPQLVQLAAALVDEETREIVSSIDLIVKPDGYSIPKEASSVHGISTEMAHDLGLPMPMVLRLFVAMWGHGCDYKRSRVGHNVPFDNRVIRIALTRCEVEDSLLEDWSNGISECTMKMAKPIVKCPPTEKMVAAGFTSFKNPNLGECYEYFLDKKLEGAHNAMVDVKACIDIFFAMKYWGKVPAL